MTQPEPHVFQERPTDHPQDISKKNQADQANYREQQGADLRPQRPHKPSRDQYRRRKPSTAVYEPTPSAEAPLQVPEISIPVTLRGEEVGSRTTAAPETVTLAAQPRLRTRRPGAPLRRRRPTTTAPPEPTATEPSTPEDFLKYEKQEEEATRQVDVAKKRRIKPVATQPSLEEVGVTEKKTNIRKRPGHRNRVNPGEPFEAEIVTEIVHAPLSTYKSPTESVPPYTTANEFNQFAASGQPNQQFDYTESQRVATVEEKQRGADSVTPSIPFEYQTDSSIRAKPHEDPNSLVTYNPGPSSESVATNIPLEDLFVRTEGNYLDRGTVSSTSQSNVATTTAPPTAPPSSTQPPPLSTSTARSHKIRPIRYGNATRPRFSIKDYKSRMDYKSRLAQISSTEPPAPAKQRGGSPSLKSQQSQQSGGEGGGGRETTGRYKYVSRVNYRTSSPNPPAKDQQEYAAEEEASTSTERSNRFVPKRRPVNGNVYRSRVSSVANRNHHDTDTSAQSKPGTARPENVFSSSVRRRPVMKARLTPQQSSTAPYQEARDGEGTEMAAEETSFYSAVTTMGAGNEVGEKEGASDSTTSVATTRSDEAGKKEEAEIESEMIEPGYHSRGGMENGGKEVVEEPVVVVTEKSVDESQLRESWGVTEQYSTARIEETTEIGGKGVVESTTKFEIRSEEEELFAKASQSVADLTSSASALYDKPGMFKAVSPESRIAVSHFKIPTDEPTLPIEAFFQELSRKS